MKPSSDPRWVEDAIPTVRAASAVVCCRPPPSSPSRVSGDVADDHLGLLRRDLSDTPRRFTS
jgi:hypothetical protein